jgi:transcriptional regulator with XRE-family HTH domain
VVLFHTTILGSEVAMNMFGDFLRKKRLGLGKGLRTFCLENGLDASNYSKIERGTLPPPSHEKIENYAEFLGIEKNSDDWHSLFDLAAIGKKRIPDYVFNNEEFVSSLPLLFRKADTGEHYTKEELIRIAEDIRKSR